MSAAAKPGQLQRYKEVATLLWKYGRSDLVTDIGLESHAEPPKSRSENPDPRELAADLERLGPAYIKLGQLLSTRADILPSDYLEALARLQDSVAPFSFDQVEKIVTTELNVRLSKAFDEFDAVPLAAASLGQVHRALLRGGRAVAVKVQRPGIREQIQSDFETFAKVAEMLDRYTTAGRALQFRAIVGQFETALTAELDYRQEARNLAEIGEKLRAFDRIVVPRPVLDYTTSHVLTMDWIDGTKLTKLHPVVKIEVDGGALAEELFRAYLQQVLVDGFFHADPHPGNVYLTEDDNLALLDLGMVARVSPELRDRLLRFLLAIGDGNGEAAAEEILLAAVGLEPPDTGELRRRIASLVAAYQSATLEQFRMGRVVLEVSRLSAEAGLRLPTELTMVAKALLNLDDIGRALDPEFDPNASVRRNAASLLRQRVGRSTTPGHFFASLLDAKEFLGKLPQRVNRVLDLAAKNGFRVKVDTIDEELLIQGLHKIANRIALGLILAALIVGAALLMQVPTPFRILGYPGLAMLFFLGAAAGGVVLALGIVFGDRTRRSPPPWK
ncbi:MAG: ABC1 kinase family protein [Thermoanaerobaculia bacterium]